jgi:hypothetical protein
VEPLSYRRAADGGVFSAASPAPDVKHVVDATGAGDVERCPWSPLAHLGPPSMSAVGSLSGGKRTPREHAKIDVNDPKVSFGNGYTSVSWQGVRYLLDHNVVRHQIVKVDERRDSAGFHYGPINRRARK